MIDHSLARPGAVRGRLRRSSHERLTHGLYVPRVRALAEELRAWSLVLPPTAAFTHLRAAELLGWWLPAPIVHPVFAAVGVNDRRRRPGLFACRHPSPGPHHLVGGLRVTTPGETLLACARDLGVLDLVVMADSALRLGHCGPGDLRRAAAFHRRGAPRPRAVVDLVDARNESAWESVLRVLHRAAEIEVAPQHVIQDATGGFIARADLWLPGTRRLHEYDGAVHREPEVHRSDLTRDRSLVRAGWERIGLTSRDVLCGAAELIADVDGLLGRSWDPRRLAAWESLVEESLFHRRGRARALSRWRMP